jgi:hypothetical protein
MFRVEDAPGTPDIVECPAFGSIAPRRGRRIVELNTARSVRTGHDAQAVRADEPGTQHDPAGGLVRPHKYRVHSAEPWPGAHAPLRRPHAAFPRIGSHELSARQFCGIRIRTAHSLLLRAPWRRAPARDPRGSRAVAHRIRNRSRARSGSRSSCDRQRNAMPRQTRARRLPESPRRWPFSCTFLA